MSDMVVNERKAHKARLLECSKMRSQNDALKYIRNLIKYGGADILTLIMAVCDSNITDGDELVTGDRGRCR